MAHTRVKPAGWSVGEILTSAQANALDIDHTKTWTVDGDATLTADVTIDVDGNELAFIGGAVEITASNLRLTGTGWPTFGSRSITDWTPSFHLQAGDPANWDLVPSNGYLTTGLGTPAATDFLAFHLGSLPIGMVVSSVSVPIASPSSAAEPATKPTIQFLSYPPTSTSPNVYDTGTDPYTDLSTFQGIHRLTVTVDPTHTIADGLRYMVLVTNMGGANAVSGLRVGRPMMSGTLSTLRTA